MNDLGDVEADRIHPVKRRSDRSRAAKFPRAWPGSWRCCSSSCRSDSAFMLDWRFWRGDDDLLRSRTSPTRSSSKRSRISTSSLHRARFRPARNGRRICGEQVHVSELHARVHGVARAFLSGSGNADTSLPGKTQGNSARPSRPIPRTH